jgi:hypothetical protein
MPYFEVEWAQKWAQSTTTMTTTAILKRLLRIPTRELCRDRDRIQESYNKVVTVPWYTTSSIGYTYSL